MASTLKQAQPEDIDGIYRGAVDFFEYAQFEKVGLSLDEVSFKSTVLNMMEDPDSIVLLVMEGTEHAGCIAGYIKPYAFNVKIKIALELFFWIFPKYRGISAIRLYKRFEQLCKKRGAHHVFMMSIPTDLQDGVDQLYHRLGYDLHEKLFIKSLS